MPSTAADSTALRAVAALGSYLAAYSAQDLVAIAAHLDSDIEVFMGNQRVARGRDSILPSYEADWARGSVVDVIRPALAEVETDDGKIVVNVGLRSSPPEALRGKEGANVVCLDVEYTLRVEDMIQVRHDITVISTDAT